MHKTGLNQKTVIREKNEEYERLEYKENIELITDETELTIKDIMKDPILIKVDKKIDKLSEIALKEFILNRIEEFLLEMGCGFTYYGSEVKLGKYKCDLLFYNVEFRRYVVIELKIRKLKAEDIGQIHLYKNYIDLNMKKDYMNDTVGIVLCKEKDKVVVEYMTDENIFFSTYQLT